MDGLRPTERRNLAVQMKPEPLIPREMVVGVKERIDSLGNICRPLDEDDVRNKVHYLIDKGAKGFVVSLLWSPLNPVHEKRIREIIREEYFMLGKWRCSPLVNPLANLLALTGMFVIRRA